MSAARQPRGQNGGYYHLEESDGYKIDEGGFDHVDSVANLVHGSSGSVSVVANSEASCGKPYLSLYSVYTSAGRLYVRP